MELHPVQFKKYQPAAQEGKEVSDWLSTDRGHSWQDHYKLGSNMWGGGIRSPAIQGTEPESVDGEANGFFSMKEDQQPKGWEKVTGASWPKPAKHDDITP